MNGKLAASGLVKQLYVNPASHDAGAAIGAALMAHDELGLDRPRAAGVFVPYMGTDLDEDGACLHELAPWKDLLHWDEPVDVLHEASALLAGGKILGWAQGRSEFGPRALGHRSILADPRPRDNWPRINQIIKRREDFRPFAPVVKREAFDTYFDPPPACVCNVECMNFIVDVRPAFRELLGATTHVDGSARIQVVDADTAPNIHGLLSSFERLTGLPVLLNTSFNASDEPIVNSAHDAIQTFLSSGLDALMLGQRIVTRAFVGTLPTEEKVTVALAAGVVLQEMKPGAYLATRGTQSAHCPSWLAEVATSGEKVSVATMLAGDTAHLAGDKAHSGQRVPSVLEDLWRRRFIDVVPLQL
jgi:predicted NodU family carbamoyl transferase